MCAGDCNVFVGTAAGILGDDVRENRFDPSTAYRACLRHRPCQEAWLRKRWCRLNLSSYKPLRSIGTCVESCNQTTFEETRSAQRVLPDQLDTRRGTSQTMSAARLQLSDSLMHLRWDSSACDAIDKPDKPNKPQRTTGLVVHVGMNTRQTLEQAF